MIFPNRLLCKCLDLYQQKCMALLYMKHFILGNFCFCWDYLGEAIILNVFFTVKGNSVVVQICELKSSIQGELLQINLWISNCMNSPSFKFQWWQEWKYIIRIRSLFSCLIAVWPWVIYLTFWDLGFLIHKMGIIIFILWVLM